MDTNNLGLILKKRRKEKKLTLVQFSSLSGVSAPHIGRVERGERFPSAHILIKLAEPLGFREAELLMLAGYLSRDDSQDRVERLKSEIKEIALALINIHLKIDGLCAWLSSFARAEGECN